eukprot:412478-Rhodomonas_salina.3
MAMSLRTRYATHSTDTAYGPTRFSQTELHDLYQVPASPICLRACYAMPGTELANGDSSLCLCCAMC